MNNSFMENDTFKFDESNNENNNYEMISGLGQSDYENEDLFNFENINSNEIESVDEETKSIDGTLETSSDENDMTQPDLLNVFEPDYLYEVENLQNLENNNLNFEESKEKEETYDEDYENEFVIPTENEEEEKESEMKEEEAINAEQTLEAEEKLDIENQEQNEDLEETISQEEIIVQEPIVEKNEEAEANTNESENISFSGTPIEELNKLTEYIEEKVETTDIKSLFDKVGVNVKEASDIFKKNSEMKEKIDSRFEELKKLQLEVEKAKKSQYDEINSYKEEVLNKLTEKKEEIEKRLNKLKEYQTKLEKEKEEFEVYKKSEKEEIERVQKEIQEAYEGRREELAHIEDVLRKQKDALDEERSQLSLDRIQYESDKNELANNLLKFNEIVGSFTNGVEKLNKEEE